MNETLQTKDQSNAPRCEAAHSPLPWNLEHWQYAGRGTIPTIVSATGKDAIAQVLDLWCMDERAKERTANAAYIVKACNEFPELLRAAVDTLAYLHNATSDEFQRGSDKPIRDRLSKIIERCSNG